MSEDYYKYEYSLIKRLESNKVRKTLIEFIEYWQEQASMYEEGLEETTDSSYIFSDESIDMADCAYENDPDAPSYYPFYKVLATVMEEPYIITDTELNREFHLTLARMNLSPGEIYDAFIANVLQRHLIIRQSSDFFIDSVPYYQRSGQTHIHLVSDNDKTKSLNLILWSKNGINCVLSKVDFSESPDMLFVPGCMCEKKVLIFARIAGVLSENTCKLIAERLSQVLPSIFKSLRLLHLMGDQPDLLQFLGEKNQTIDLKYYKDNLDFIKTCIDAYYSKSTTKDTIDRRIRNAIHLMVEADRQQHRSIMLALSFSAIEALVCSKKEGIVDELSRNVATLLEPDRNMRIQTIKLVKKLYNMRSKLLHGENIEINLGKEEQVRRLAAGCLKAMLEWQVFQRKVGKEQKSAKGRDNFFSELEDAKVSGREMVGIPEN